MSEILSAERVKKIDAGARERGSITFKDTIDVCRSHETLRAERDALKLPPAEFKALVAQSARPSTKTAAKIGELLAQGGCAEAQAMQVCESLLKIESEIYDEALEKAARLIDTWHISKGGFGELAHQIREMRRAKEPRA
jgi:hypothetical protein